jgi:EmrB/QacA subfamily drug resistance transporter
MKNRMLVMVSIVLSMLVISMDTTIINTTMPIIATELGGFELFAWTFAGYMILETVLAPIAGRLSDLFGRKRVFACGIVLFLIGSILCGFSQSMLQLVIFRAIQGMGAGIMIPFPMIIAGDLFTIQDRGKIQAAFSTMWALSAIIAPLLGSLFVEYASWRWIFFINIPICFVCLMLLIPYKEVFEPKKSQVDYLGAMIFSAAIGLLLAVTVVGSGHFIYVTSGVLLLIVFALYERRHASPIVPLSLLKNKSIAWLNVNCLLAFTSMFGAGTFLPLFLQERGYSIFLSGIALLGMSASWMVMGVQSGKWIISYGYKQLMIIANVLLVVSAGWFLFISSSSGFWFVFIGSMLIGLAFGLQSTVSTIGSQQLADAHEMGISTSLSIFSKNIGTAVGVTIMGAFLAKAPDLITGYHYLFYFGFIVSLLSLGSSFLIRADRHLV